MLVDLIIFSKKHPALRPFLFYGGAFLLGLIGAYAMPPTSWWPLLFISLSGLYCLYALCQSAGQAFRLGFLYALGYFLTGLWWIGNALLVEGNEFAWVWPLSVIGLPTLLSLFYAVALGCAYIISCPLRFAGLFAFAACFALAEWVRGHIFTGFPWNLFAYSWSEALPIAQITSVIGSYGLSLLTLFWTAAIGFLYVSLSEAKHKLIGGLTILASLALCFAWGSYRLASNPTVLRADTAIHIVQPNIPQAEKWKPENLVPNFEKHVGLSAYRMQAVPANTKQASQHIVVWPETALAPVLTESQAAREQIASALKTYPAPASLLSGALLRQWKGEGKQFTNSLVKLDADGSLSPLYHKTHLVPFGEYIPFQDLIPIRPVAQFQGFERGNGPETFFTENIPAFAPLICYEIIFPGNIVSDAIRASWIVTVTNDAWYGDSAGPPQHFAHIIFRSIEEGLPVIRSANTGISGLSDSFGRVHRFFPRPQIRRLYLQNSTPRRFCF